MLSFSQFLDAINEGSTGAWPKATIEKDAPGIYTARMTHGKGKKAVHTDHEVHAKSHQDAVNIIAQRHNEQHKLHPTTSHYIRTQYHGAKKQEAGHPAKQPHRDSKEQQFRDEMQKRYDSLGYKGD